jgi:hypothetical protein
MKQRWASLVVAAIFLIVGILATSNTIRLNRYIEQTLPRDQAQEQCNSETIETLKTWIGSRINRDAAMDARDDAAIASLDQIIIDGKASPEKISAWRDAVERDRAVRAAAGEHLGPLPDCRQ